MTVNDTAQPEPVQPEPAASGTTGFAEATPRPRVVLIGGASGSGKSFLARRYGRPHLPLDSFYRPQSEDAAEGGDGPAFPRTPYGEIDWDDPGTWNGPAAVEAIVQLRQTGTAQIPDYDISTSSIVGTVPLHLEYGNGSEADASGAGASGAGGVGGPIVAEGIFATQMPALLEAAGVPFDAWYIDQSPVTTAVRRFARDVAERRKPIPFLLQRGWALFRTDGARKQAAVDAGFVARSTADMQHDLFAMAGAPAEDA